MEGTLIQQNRVKEKGSMNRKLLLIGNKFRYLYLFAGTYRISTG